MTLDVTSPVSGAVIGEATKIFGRIDVLVNNAGYSVLGAVEDIRYALLHLTSVFSLTFRDSEEESQDQFATNFFGPLRLIRSILPIFRAQKSGTIVNITSVAGFDGLPTSGLYAASKFALEGKLLSVPSFCDADIWLGLSESLAREVTDFNIRVLLVEPGAFRTRFLQSKAVPNKELTSAYIDTTVGNTLKYFDVLDGTQRGDAAKASSRIIDVVTKSGIAAGLDKEYLRLPIGPDCIERLDQKIENMKLNVDALRTIGLGTDL
jgi:NAD(P)-dependent dehydrogenase (short-subunit alcohol dehydrogenase family)